MILTWCCTWEGLVFNQIACAGTAATDPEWTRVSHIFVVNEHVTAK